MNPTTKAALKALGKCILIRIKQEGIDLFPYTEIEILVKSERSCDTFLISWTFAFPETPDQVGITAEPVSTCDSPVDRAATLEEIIDMWSGESEWDQESQLTFVDGYQVELHTALWVLRTFYREVCQEHGSCQEVNGLDPNLNILGTLRYRLGGLLRTKNAAWRSLSDLRI